MVETGVFKGNGVAGSLLRAFGVSQGGRRMTGLSQPTTDLGYDMEDRGALWQHLNRSPSPAGGGRTWWENSREAQANPLTLHSGLFQGRCELGTWSETSEWVLEGTSNGSSPRALGGGCTPVDTLVLAQGHWSHLPVLWTVRRKYVCCFKLPCLWWFVNSGHRKLTQPPKLASWRATEKPATHVWELKSIQEMFSSHSDTEQTGGGGGHYLLFHLIKS